MASLSILSLKSTILTPPSFLNPLSQFQSAKYRKPKLDEFPRVVCIRNQKNPTPNTSKGKFPHRRNLVLGLGALSGIFALNKNHPFAFASQASPPMFPLVLDSAVSTVVERPAKSRSKKEKEEEEEVLLIEGIEYEGNQYVRFDVIINAEQDYKLIRPYNPEFAGSFANEPRLSNKKIITSMSLGITDLLDQLGADDDDTIVVTLVPRIGSVQISGLKIHLLAE